jgi:hypothetical protein
MNPKESSVKSLVVCPKCFRSWACQQFNRKVHFCSTCVREGIDCKYAFDSAPNNLMKIDQLCGRCFPGG